MALSLKNSYGSALPKYHLKKCNSDEFFDLEPDGNYYELMDGVMIMIPFACWEHNSRNLEIASELKFFLKKNPVAKVNIESEIRITNDRIYRPDAVVILKNRYHIIQKKFISEAPDIVIEVLSPSTRHVDLGKKSDDYFNYGVKEYWVIDPDYERLLYSIRGENDWVTEEIKDIFESKLLKGFSVNVKEIFNA